MRTASRQLPPLILGALLIAQAGAGEAVAGEPLRIGLVPEQSVFRLAERYGLLGELIQAQTDIGLRFVVLQSYSEAIDRLRAEALEGAFLGSYTAALAIEKLALEPLARPVHADGVSTYRGFLFVRSGSGIESVGDMRGKVLVLVSRATTAGYLFPLAYFREHGVPEFDGYFRDHYFAGSHDAAIDAVRRGRADVGCAKNTVFERLAREQPALRDDLVILAESLEVPSNGLLLRRDIDPSLRRALTEALLGIHLQPAGREALVGLGWLRLVAATAEDYAPVFEVAARAGVRLELDRAPETARHDGGSGQ